MAQPLAYDEVWFWRADHSLVDSPDRSCGCRPEDSKLRELVQSANEVLVNLRNPMN